ncbi:MAG: hypothetical protein WB680_14715, partial [Candidatus Acidiferrales bacterium]
ERLQASRGRRQGQRTRRTKTLFEVNGEVRFKKKLTRPTLLEISDYALHHDLMRRTNNYASLLALHSLMRPNYGKPGSPSDLPADLEPPQT